MKIRGINGNAAISVMNISGQKVYSENITLGGATVKEFDLTTLAPGVYFVRLQTQSHTITEQVVVQ